MFEGRNDSLDQVRKLMDRFEDRLRERHVLDRGRIRTGTVDYGLDHGCGEILGGYATQTAAEAADLPDGYDTRRRSPAERSAPRRAAR